jgi:hypothetical protein
VGTEAEAARAEVVAAREAFSGELARLEAAGRAAVDVKAKVRRNPARAAGLAAGAGFLAVGGPLKVARGVGRVLRGKKEPSSSSSLLPKEVDKALASLGDDGKKVRSTLEREFARYLEQRKSEEDRGLLGGIAGAVTAGLVVPASRTFARRLASQLANVDEADFRRALDGVRGRASAAAQPDGLPGPAGAGGPSTGPRPPAGPKAPTVR